MKVYDFLYFKFLRYIFFFLISKKVKKILKKIYEYKHNFKKK